MVMANKTDDDLREVLKADIERAGTQCKWAREHDFSRQYVNDLLRGRRDVSEPVAAALGYKKIKAVWYAPTAAETTDDKA